MAPASERAEAFDPPIFQLLTEVAIIAQLSQNLAGRLLAPEMNMAQFSVLNHFARVGTQESPVQLARTMQVTKGAMTNTIARLQDRGWVCVRPDPADGRGKRVAMTPQGAAARRRAVDKLGAVLGAMDAQWPAQDVVPTLAALRQLRAWFDARR